MKIAAACNQQSVVFGKVNELEAKLSAMGRIIGFQPIQTLSDHFLHQSGYNPDIRMEHAGMGKDGYAPSLVYHGDGLRGAIAEAGSPGQFMPAKILIECLVKIIHHTTLDQETGEMGPASLAMARHSQ